MGKNRQKLPRVGVILAGGKGERFGGNFPKQFAKLAGRPVLSYTLEKFQKSSSIDQILVVSASLWEEKVWEIARKWNISKLERVVLGGESRFDSTRSALEALADYPPETTILIHDGVRPFVSEEIIGECVRGIEERGYRAVDTGIPAVDTIIQVNSKGEIAQIPPRSQLRHGQTPQAFRLGVLREAYRRAVEAKRRDFTCDCGVVHKMLPDEPILVVAGSPKNRKITYPLDIYIGEKLIQLGEKSGGNPVDLRKLKGKRVVVFGGSSGIGKEIVELGRKYGGEFFSASRREGVEIGDRKQISKFLSALPSPLDGIIVTSGVLIRKPLEFFKESEIGELLTSNYLGVINIAREGKKYLKKPGGVFITFGSSSYTRGRKNYLIYSSLKAGIVNFTQGLAEEWELEGIRVNCVVPERTATPMRRQNFGLEDPSTLLDPREVAEKTLQLFLGDETGVILEIKKE